MCTDGEDKTYWVYILASRRYGTLYVGITGGLVHRVIQHKEKRFPGFTSTYGVDRLVYFKGFGEVGEAIRFEKQLKRWRRDWKINLIERDNPRWDDLYTQFVSPTATVKPVLIDPENPPAWLSP